MVALTQRDFKFVIGYSSVSHMGFVLLGLMTLNLVGLSGAVLQMFSHGIIAGLLFAVVGRMVYDRTHAGMTVHAGWPGDAVRRGDVHAGERGVDGAAGVRGCGGVVLIGAWQVFPGSHRRGFGVVVGRVHPGQLAPGPPAGTDGPGADHGGEGGGDVVGDERS
jgi:NADH-quinone oxidoreductase subunit M